MRTTNWAAWEYRVLAEGHPPEKAARLLGRPQEVVAAKARRECEPAPPAGPGPSSPAAAPEGARARGAGPRVREGGGGLGRRGLARAAVPPGPDPAGQPDPAVPGAPCPGRDADEHRPAAGDFGQDGS